MSDYKRLTHRFKEYIDTNCENCKQWKKFGNGYACMDMTACDEEIINRLAELEDKIENGTLIELPCKVGDKVYYLTSEDTAKELNVNEFFCGTVQAVSFDGTSIWIPVKYTNGLYYYHKSTDFGKTIFLTKPEAEARLRELKGR